MLGKISAGLMAVFLSASGTIGQATFGSIVSVVKDPGEGTIVDAQITLTNLDDHAQRNTSADSNGGFEFANLKPGHYESVVHADGFSEYEVSRGLGQPSFREMGNLTKTPIVQIALARASGC